MKEAGDLTGFFTIGYRLVNGVKESVKYGLTYIYATYQDMLQAIKDLRSLEATVEENEDSRVTAETGRNATEQARGIAESGRVSAESNRVTAEGIRVSQENARKSAESARVTAETNRVSAEDTRKVAESARSTEEGKRVAAESTRVNAESTRASAEGTRVSQETARKTAETARASAETIRVSQEDARKAAETARVTTETNRISAEDARKVAESGRSTEEGKRVAAESARVTAETNRASAESTRVSQETTRKTSEAARVNTESSRVSQETARATAETARVTAESKRVTEFGTLKQTVEAVVSNADDTASHATYIGPDHYVYTWNKTTKAYDKTDIYCKGDAFSVKKVYASISALQADVNNAGIKVGDFVLVNTDNVENPDNARLYVKSKNVSGVFSYDFLVDMSGAIGFTGKTPQLSIGTVSQGAAPTVTLSENGVDASGNPRYKLNLVLPQGEKGEAPVLSVGTVTTGAPGSQASASLVPNGSTSTGAPRYNLNLTIPQGPQGPGNVQVSVDGLLAGKNYLFKPSANGSANGTLVEYAPSQSDWSASDAASPSFIRNKPATFTPSAHRHVKGDITDFPSSMPASDVPSWAKQSSKPTYTAAEVGAVSKGGDTMTGPLKSSVTLGTAPIQVTSTTLCQNLNADLLDGYHVNQLMWRDPRGSAAGLTPDSVLTSRYGFGYSSDGWPATGSFISFGGFTDQYVTQIQGSYTDPGILYVRSRNDDSDKRWNSWRKIVTCDSDNKLTSSGNLTVGMISLYGNNEINCSSDLYLNYRGGQNVITNVGGGYFETRGRIYASDYITSYEGWFQNNISGTGLYNQAEDARWFAYSGKWLADKSIRSNIHIEAGGYLYSNANDLTLQMGSQNSSYCHIVTSAPSFYFNTHLVVNGNLLPYNGPFDLGSYALPWKEVWVNGWLRSDGDMGWYSTKHGGGIHMEDDDYVKVYNSKAFQVTNPSYRSIFNYGGYYRGVYEGASWNNGRGALNVEIFNNSAQTPLIVAARSDGFENPTANRLFAMELLNTGTSLNFTMGTTVQMTINKNGNVAMGFQAHAAGGFFKQSDIRLKTDIRDMDYSLEQILSIPTSSFMMDGQRQIGSIAQEVEKVCPEIVYESHRLRSDVPDCDDWEVETGEVNGEPVEYVKVKSVEYEMLGVLGIEGLKLLYEEFKSLKDLVKKQENRIVALEKTVSNDE